MGVEPKIVGIFPQNGWFIMENLIKMDDLGGKNPYFWVDTYVRTSESGIPPKTNPRTFSGWDGDRPSILRIFGKGLVS